jgi:salicylate hydroxylase
MAQGANQAIEDALTLAACLSGVGSGQRASAFREYEAKRIPRTTAIQLGARQRAAAGRPAQHDGVAAGLDDGLAGMDWLYGYDAEPAGGRLSVRRPEAEAAFPPA